MDNWKQNKKSHEGRPLNEVKSFLGRLSEATQFSPKKDIYSSPNRQEYTGPKGILEGKVILSLEN